MEDRSFSLDKGKLINETSNLAFLGGNKCKDSIASSTWSLKARSTFACTRLQIYVLKSKNNLIVAFDTHHYLIDI